MTDKPVIEAEYGDERWLEAASGVSRSTWQKRRMSGRDGPPFVKLGHAVIYHKATTLAWIAARAQTREPRAA